MLLLLFLSRLVGVVICAFEARDPRLDETREWSWPRDMWVRVSWGGGVKVKVQVQQGAMYVPRQVGIRRRDEQNLPRWTTPTSTSKSPSAGQGNRRINDWKTTEVGGYSGQRSKLDLHALDLAVQG